MACRISLSLSLSLIAQFVPVGSTCASKSFREQFWKEIFGKILPIYEFNVVFMMAKNRQKFAILVGYFFTKKFRHRPKKVAKSAKFRHIWSHFYSVARNLPNMICLFTSWHRFLILNVDVCGAGCQNISQMSKMGPAYNKDLRDCAYHSLCEASLA